MTALKPILPHGGSLLQIGEPNWYGDIAPSFPCTNPDDKFAIARDFYASLFAPQKSVSIDFEGTAEGLKLDLNLPIDLRERFDLVINHGTVEHIFNIAQVFKTIHDHCAVGGLMIHEAPFTGWIDHGFFCLQPTLFCDLATANGYQIRLLTIEVIHPLQIIQAESREHIYRLAQAGQIPNNAMLFVVLKKQREGEFRVPMQGYYAQQLSDEGNKAWKELR